MAKRGSLRKRIETLEASPGIGEQVTMATRSPSGELTVSMTSGRHLRGEAAEQALAQALAEGRVPEGGIWMINNIDVDVVLGRKLLGERLAAPHQTDDAGDAGVGATTTVEHEGGEPLPAPASRCQQDGAEDQSTEVEADEIEAAQVVPTETAHDR